MKLSSLLSTVAAQQHGGDPQISAITPDSRAVRRGALFVAVPGLASDGHDFIAAAIAAGAAAVLVQADHAAALAHLPVPFAVVADTRAALAAVAAAFYGFPARRLRVLGVTGTDGKTTTAYLIEAVLRAAGKRTGLFGTIAYKVGERWLRNPGRLTTPGAPEVQALLAEMVTAGVEDAILESTSHGLELHRLDHCEYDVAVFTNLTPDHLDLHGTVEAYRAAKGRLFQMLDEPTVKTGRRYAVLNADDSTSGFMHSLTRAPAIHYGLREPAEIAAETIALRPAGARFRLRTPAGTAWVDLPLPGMFNVSNALAAATVAYGEGMAPQAIAAALGRFDGVPGRMERIDGDQPFTVIVDYAHTGEALATVLQTLRPLTQGRILAVYGSAAERGHSRREGMARAAAAGADFSVLTDEDPRFEDPEAILDEIAATLRSNGKTEPDDFIRIVDREAAIREAVRRASPGDIVLLAGKGHEQSIERRGEACPWDDRDSARRALTALGYRPAAHPWAGSG